MGKKNPENGYHGKPKKAKNGIFARKTLGATDLKLGVHIQLNSGNDMGCVPSGHTSSLSCGMLKIPKIVYQQKYLNQWS